MLGCLMKYWFISGEKGVVWASELSVPYLSTVRVWAFKEENICAFFFFSVKVFQGWNLEAVCNRKSYDLNQDDSLVYCLIF